jgi:ubiquitin carboxyl-terminal hydrolase 35/38
MGRGEIKTQMLVFSQGAPKTFAELMMAVPEAARGPSLRLMAAPGQLADAPMVTAVGNMMGWLAWPRDTGVHAWVLVLLAELAAAQRTALLLDVAATYAAPLLQLVAGNPAAWRGSLAVLSALLLGHQHSPSVFHALLPAVPSVLASAPDDAAAALAALMHALMQHHSGYPELYQPLLEVHGRGPERSNMPDPDFFN